MTTTMSSSKREQFAFLYRFALKKSLGWTAIYTILLFLCYPLLTYSSLANISHRYEQNEYRLTYIMDDHFLIAFLVSALLCAMVLIVSVVLNAYMHSKRSADFFHSMPVNRSVMLTANFAAGLTSVTVPIWINSIIAMVAYPIFVPKANIAKIIEVLSLEVVAWTIGAFILLAISTMVAVCASTAIENVGYTIAVLLEGSLILLIWDLSCTTAFDTYLSIFDYSEFGTFFTELLYFLSPVFALGRVIIMLQDKLTSSIGYVGNIGWTALLFWLVLGVAALYLAVKLYEKRQSERAEQWGRQTWLGFAVKLLSAIIGAWLFGNIFGELLGMSRNFYYTFGALVGAPLVYIVIEAITNRGFHNMKKCLPYLATAVGITFAFSLYFVFDGFGFDERIPKADNVSSVKLEMFSLDEYVRYDDDYAMIYANDKEDPWNYEQNRMYELTDTITIDKIIKIHENSVDYYNGDAPINAEYLGYMRISYDQGLFDLNRDIRVYGSYEELLELLYSDEFMQKYNPLFVMKPEYLEYVQIQDKAYNLIGDGEIPAEAYGKLLDAIRADMMAATPEQLLDAKNNQEVAVLWLDTKYPKEIHESTGELYHYDMTQKYFVRKSDVNTIALLEQLGFELKVDETYYDTILSIVVGQAYAGGRTPGIANGSGYGEAQSLEKRDYYVAANEITDKEQIRKVMEQATSVYSGKNDQYMISVYSDINATSQFINIKEFYIDRNIIMDLMLENDSSYAPYILSDEERSMLGMEITELEKTVIATVRAEEYVNWNDVHTMENWISIKDFAEEHCPQLLEGKSAAELNCMDMTPYISEDGTVYVIGF